MLELKQIVTNKEQIIEALKIKNFDATALIEEQRFLAKVGRKTSLDEYFVERNRTFIQRGKS